MASRDARFASEGRRSGRVLKRNSWHDMKFGISGIDMSIFMGIILVIIPIVIVISIINIVIHSRLTLPAG